MLLLSCRKGRPRSIKETNNNEVSLGTTCDKGSAGSHYIVYLVQQNKELRMKDPAILRWG